MTELEGSKAKLLAEPDSCFVSLGIFRLIWKGKKRWLVNRRLVVRWTKNHGQKKRACACVSWSKSRRSRSAIFEKINSLENGTGLCGIWAFAQKLEQALSIKELHDFLTGLQIVVNFLSLRFHYVWAKLRNEKEKSCTVYVRYISSVCACNWKGVAHASRVKLYPKPNCRRVKLPSGDGVW